MSSNIPILSELEREFAFRLKTYPFYKFKPAPFQMKAVNSRSKYLAILGGNGSGKSELAAWLTARELITKKPYKKNAVWWYIARTMDMHSVCWEEKLKNYISPNNILNISWHNAAKQIPSQIRLKNGWIIEFKSTQQGRESLQARSIGGATFDEQWIDESIFNEVIMRCRETDNARVIMALTPIEPDPELQAKYLEPPPNWEFYEFNLLDTKISRGGWAPDERIDQLVSTISPEYYDTRVLGKFANLQGTIYKGFNKEKHVLSTFKLPSDGKIFRSIDFGFNHTFACLWIHQSTDGVYTIFDEYGEPQKLLAEHSKQILSRNYDIYRTYADYEDAQGRSELRHLGIDTYAAIKDVNAGIEQVSKCFIIKPNGQPNLYITANCKKTIRELSLYVWDETKDKPKKENDHYLDALRYCIFTNYKHGSNIKPNSHVCLDEPKTINAYEAIEI